MFLSDHAQTRTAQRNLSNADIDFIVKHGERLHRTGVVFYQLHAQSIPRDLPGNHRYRRLVGSTVMLCSCEKTIITAYRNRDAFKRDKRKSKYSNKTSYAPCPNCAHCTLH